MQKKKLKEKKILTKKNISKSSSINLVQEIIGFHQLFQSIKKYKPDIIHCASPKGIIFGGLISKFLDIKSLVIFNSGMGFLFSNRINLIFKLVKWGYIFLLKNFSSLPLYSEWIDFLVQGCRFINKWLLLKRFKLEKNLL